MGEAWYREMLARRADRLCWLVMEAAARERMGQCHSLSAAVSRALVKRAMGSTWGSASRAGWGDIADRVRDVYLGVLPGEGR